MEEIDEERKKTTEEEAVLFTIGYEGINFEDYVDKLLKNGVRVLYDVRKNAISRKYGFSKGILSRLLPELGVTYTHIPELGIDSRKRRDLKKSSDYAKLFEEYHKTLSEKYTPLKKVKELLKNSRRVALTCFERDPSFCHRHCVSDYMATNHAIRTIHL